MPVAHCCDGIHLVKGVMRNPIVASLVAFLLAPAITAAQTQAKIETGFLDRSVSLGGQTYRYQIFVPASYDGSPKFWAWLFAQRRNP